MDLGLSGTRGLVTGAASGIGRASARLLAAEGVRLVLLGRRPDPLERLAAELEATGASPPEVVVADLAAAGGAERAVETTLELFGGLDLLVNNAGQADAPGVPLTEEAWRRHLELNFHAKRVLAERLRPFLATGGRGRIVNLVGILEPRAVSAAQASVAACVVWSKAFSREVAAEGITVNCLAPGRIDSAQLRRHFPTRESRMAFAAEHVPAGRFGEPEEAATLIAYLCSSGAGYITGQTIAVDGGMSRAV